MVNETPVLFHNFWNYHYHFIIKEWANKLEGKFECLGKNTEKYKTFFVPTEKEVKKVDKDSNGSVATIYYYLEFIDNARFLAM